MSLELSDKQAETQLKTLWAKAVEFAPRQHPDRTPQCPSLFRLTEALSTGWQVDEQAHVDHCGYCQRTWESAQRIAAEPIDADLDDVWADVPTDPIIKPVTDSADATPRRSVTSGLRVAMPLGADTSPRPASTDWSRSMKSADARIRGELSWEGGQLVWLSDHDLAFEASTVARCQWLDAAGIAVAETKHGAFNRAVQLPPLDPSRQPLRGDRLIVEFCEPTSRVLASAEWPVCRDEIR